MFCTPPYTKLNLIKESSIFYSMLSKLKGYQAINEFKVHIYDYRGLNWYREAARAEAS